MNTPTTVTNATARLNMESVNRLIETEVNFDCAKLRGENRSLQLAVRELQTRLLFDGNRHAARCRRDGKMMAFIGIGCGIVGVIFGHFASEVFMR